MVNGHVIAHQVPFAVIPDPINLCDDLSDEGYGEPVSEDREHTFATILAKDASAVARLPLLLPHIDSVDFTAHKTDYYLSCRDLQYRQLVRLQLMSDQDVAWLDALAPQGARDLAELLATAQAITTFTINTDFACLVEEDIEEMLACFPSLQTLHLKGRSSLEDVWGALTPIAEPGGEVDILCPDLETVTVDGDRFLASDGFFEDILPMLRERDAYGDRLACLDMALMPAAWDEEEAEAEDRRLRAKYLPELEQVVTKVSYETLEWVQYDWEHDVGI